MFAIPQGLDGNVEPDGTGYLVLSGPGGVYSARPDGLRRVTTGALLAVGPSRWLTLECDDQYRCASVVIDRGTGARRILDAPAAQTNRLPGLISPSGSTAALLETDSGGVTSVHMLDLKSAADHWLDVPIDLFFDYARPWSGRLTAGGCSSRARAAGCISSTPPRHGSTTLTPHSRQSPS